jgi:ADP-heptose:LPS heptosyltransferase
LHVDSLALPAGEPTAILCICLSHLGDLVLLTPLFANLRLRYPQAHIVVVCKSIVGEIPRNHPAVDEIITYEARWTVRPGSPHAGFLDTFKLIRGLRARSFDLLVVCYDHPMDRILGLCSGIPGQISLDGGLARQRKGDVEGTHLRHRVEHAFDLLRAFEVPIVDTAPSIGVPAADVVWADEWLGEQGLMGKTILGVHPGAGGPEQRWPADRFARVAEDLAGKFRCKIVVTGSPIDADQVEGFLHNVRVDALQAPMTLTVSQLCALIQRFAALFCNDCGPMHIAAALRVPVVVVFRAGKPELWAPCPADPRHVTVTSSDARIESVTVEQVIGAIAGSPDLMHHLSRESRLVLKSGE